MGLPASEQDAQYGEYRIPIIAEHLPYPVTVPYLPYIQRKCEDLIRELQRNPTGEDEATNTRQVERLTQEMHAAIRDCADRITRAMEEVGS